MNKINYQVFDNTDGFVDSHNSAIAEQVQRDPQLLPHQDRLIRHQSPSWPT